MVAIDDTKGHRTSADVWGSCTFHESTARSPNRAETVRAHNWVVMGELVPGKPWTYLPCASRLYFRKSQTPVGEVFRTKTSWAVDMMREVDDESDAPILAAFDGAYAMETVIRPCLNPPEGHRRIEFVTRLRKDARLYHPLTPSKKNPKGGRPRKWGRRMAAPQNHEKWDADWQNGRAYLYGRIRNFRYKRVLCQWAVAGPEHLLYAYVFEVSGYKEPVLRTFQVQITAQTLLRLMQFRLDEQWGEQSWWSPPPWNPKKRHPSILDLRRLFWRHRDRFSKFLVRLEEMAKPPQAHFPCGRPTARAA